MSRPKESGSQSGRSERMGFLQWVPHPRAPRTGLCVTHTQLQKPHQRAGHPRCPQDAGDQTSDGSWTDDLKFPHGSMTVGNYCSWRGYSVTFPHGQLPAPQGGERQDLLSCLRRGPLLGAENAPSAELLFTEIVSSPATGISWLTIHTVFKLLEQVPLCQDRSAPLLTEQEALTSKFTPLVSTNQSQTLLSSCL